MNDDRIGRYLADQAEGIALTPADPDAVMRRGSRRRTRRRSAFVGTLAVVAVLTTTVALRDGSDDQQVKVDYESPEVSASTFDWSLVTPRAGLAYASSSVQLGGSIYSLSTAPATVGDPDPYDSAQPPVIYRSDDGAEWTAVGSPDGMRVSALSGAGDSIYALGTAPAGGGTRDLVVATSRDGAASWSNVTLPRDVAELEARHPGKISIGQPRIVARDASHLVASISVGANLDPSAYAPELAEQDGSYVTEWTDDGLTVRDAGEMCTVDVPETTVAPDVDPDAAANEGTRRQVPPEAMACRAEAAGGEKADQGEVVATYTWEQLGIDEELRGLIDGRSITYVSDDGTTFQRVEVPEEAGEWTAALVATSDGFRILRGSYGPDVAPVSTLLSSPDGHTWTVERQIPGSPGTAGLLDDHLAVSVFDERGNGRITIQQADGSWSDLDLTQAVTVPDGFQAWVGEVAFGPLGLAAVLTTSGEEEMGESYLIHSTDGTDLAVLPLTDQVPDPASVVGVVVTADAIAVRFTEPQDDDPSTPPSQVVLVGTPTD